MYCPRCASQAVEGQRFCRTCGMNLGLILDAAENRPRGVLDFETIKRDLRDLGASLRAGFDEASSAIKNTKRLDQQPAPYGQQPQLILPDLAKELKKAVGKVNAGESRKRSLQKATLSIFGGGAWMLVWKQILNAITPEMITTIEQAILQANPRLVSINLTVFLPIIQNLWLLGLIPVAKGVAHLFNGIFFAPKPEPESPPQYYFVQPGVPLPPAYASAIPDPSTNDPEHQAVPNYKPSVTEDATLRFEANK
ncbi:MAG: hypothetical protein ACREEM_20105 [Blastocatellia bacterium]